MSALRVLRGWSAALALALIVVGVPALLVSTGSWPLPSWPPSWTGLLTSLSRPDDGTVLLGILALVTWVAWLVVVSAVAVELSAQIRGRTVRGVPGVQRLAAPLVGAALTVLPWGVAASAVAVEPVAEASVENREQARQRHAAAEPLPDVPGPESPTIPDLPRYTVRSGDSLWSVAEATLGDGARFGEIAALNYGVAQPDGGALDASHWLRPGWTLAVPPGASLPAVPGLPRGAAGTPYLVQSGESLSSIARDQLGDALRYPEILVASRDVVQPDGSHLTDPDLIRPGWLLAIPDDGPTSGTGTPGSHEPPGTEPDPGTEPGTGTAAVETSRADPEPSRPPGGSGPGTVPEVTDARSVDSGSSGGSSRGDTAEAPSSPVPAPSQTRGPGDFADAFDAESDPEFDLRTAGGVGGMLAAGIIGLLTLRRVQARRSRRPGERPVLPGPGSRAAAFESGARAVADASGRELLDRVLRSLAADRVGQGKPLPALRAVRYAPDRYVELLLDAPDRLPAPWDGSRDGTLWRVDVSAVIDVPAVDPVPIAPFPALVTVGQDHEAHLLLDIERLGCLDLRGDGDDCRAVLAALAVELGTSPWADDLQVTVVGALAELPGVVDTGRIRHVPTLGSVVRELEARAGDVEVALRQAGADSLAAARTSGVHADAWTPEILLVGESLGPMARVALEQLVARVPGVGVAAVTTGSALNQWAVEVDGETSLEGVLHPAGVRLRLQRLDTDDYRRALSLIGETRTADGPPWARGLAGTEEPRLVQIPVSVSVGRRTDDPAAFDVGAASEGVWPVDPADDAGPTSGNAAPGSEDAGRAPENDAGVSWGGAGRADESAATDETGASGGGPVGGPAIPATVGLLSDVTVDRRRAYRPPSERRGVGPGAPLDDSTVPRSEDPLGIGPLDLGPLEPLDIEGYLRTPVPSEGPTPVALDPAGADDADSLDRVPDDVTSVRSMATSPASAPADRPPGSAAAAATTAAAATARVRSLRSPIVRVLGTVEVVVASGLTMPASHQRQATELIAYLAFHPGASGLDISTALWPTRAPNLATRRSAVSRARRWLGTDAEGHEHLPRYWTSGDGSSAGHESAGYRLRGVGSDWAEFLRLVGNDALVTPTARLIEALGLVRGPVFAQVPARKYVWAESLWQEMTTGIVDIAHEVARRSLLAGDLATAREASRVARLVDPADERGWRDGIKTEWADGRSQAVTRLTAQLRDHLATLDLDADPDTEDLIVDVEGQLAGRRERGA